LAIGSGSRPVACPFYQAGDISQQSRPIHRAKVNQGSPPYSSGKSLIFCEFEIVDTAGFVDTHSDPVPLFDQCYGARFALAA
jgi:hypothetical protein